ncbi:sodium:calcium antiporter [Candidatus Beckwithbacteria bacterium]|nr:sodium:calcium antiporter [Candidatus Beckwithbacteria bacterium]
MLSFFITLVDVLLFFAALFFLTKASQIIITALNALSKSSKVEIFAIAGLFSAVATSLPELFVALSSAIAGKPKLVVGMVIGSNVADVTLVIGMVAVLGGGLRVVNGFIKKDVLKSFLILMFPLTLLLDGKLARTDGALLVFAFLLYHATVLHSKRQDVSKQATKQIKNVGRWLHVLGKSYDKKQLSSFVFGIVMLLVSANVVVQTGSRIALDLHMPIVLIGLFLIAVGTSLPELALELRAARQKQVSAVFGDLLGSLIANSTLILGLTALISPVTLGTGSTSVLTASIMFLFGFALLWLFVRTKLILQRWEGLVLVGLYALFLFIEYSLA